MDAGGRSPTAPPRRDRDRCRSVVSDTLPVPLLRAEPHSMRPVLTVVALCALALAPAAVSGIASAGVAATLVMIVSSAPFVHVVAVAGLSCGSQSSSTPGGLYSYGPR